MAIVKKSELIHDDKNFNLGTEKGGAMIANSFNKFGAGRSILIDKNNRIIAGNKSAENFIGDDIQIIESDGTKLIAVKRTDIDLDTPLGREMALADNATAKANIVWAEDVIASELGVEVAEAWGIEMKSELEATEDEYEIPDVIETDIVLGDLFEIGEHRLLCGDSTDSDQVARLMDGQKADMVFTDPPYGISYKSNWKSKDREQFDEIKNDDVILDILPSLILLSKNNIHWYIWTSHHVYNIWRENFKEYYKSTIIWSKKSGAMGDLTGDYVVNYEMALFCHYGRKELNGHRESAIWELTRDSGIDYLHPTQKPISLSEKGIINSSKEKDIISDLFLGSGSTMVAAHQLNRKCYGMELDPKYCQVIIDRMIKLDPTLVITRNGEPYEAK